MQVWSGIYVPQSVIRNHKREEILYVLAIALDLSKLDYFTVIDGKSKGVQYNKVDTQIVLPKNRQSKMNFIILNETLVAVATMIKS